MAMILCALGCATAAAPAANPGAAPAGPAVRETDERLRIVDAGYGVEQSKKQSELVVPFGPNQNGTELMFGVLDEARRAGAAFVGDVALVFTFRWQGFPIECRTRVFLEGDPELARQPPAQPEIAVPAAAAPKYGTEIGGFKPQLIAFVAHDRELACTKVSVPVQKRRRLRASDRTAEGSRAADPDPRQTEVVTELEHRDSCEWKDITRPAERYDYELKLGFVPPNWSHIADRFADRRLVPAAPTCYKIADDEVAKRPPYRVVATAYHRGRVRMSAPTALPSRGAVEAETLPGGMTEEECRQMLRQSGVKPSVGRPSAGLPGEGDRDPTLEETSKTYQRCNPARLLENRRRQTNGEFFEEDEK